MLWDIFCRVIDNFGDIGVCWRLSADLAQRGHAVRLWVDDGSALEWMAPGALQGNWPGIQVHRWADAERLAPASVMPNTTEDADVWVEGFGCEVPEAFVQQRFGSNGENAAPPPVWINLEYLSAEPYVERSHRLPSPIQSGAAKGHTKHFFYPGFTPNTGGLLREPDLAVHQQRFTPPEKTQWLHSLGIPWGGEALVSLFCYEPPVLGQLLANWATDSVPRRLLVTTGRASASVRAELVKLNEAGITIRRHPNFVESKCGQSNDGDAENYLQVGQLHIHFLLSLSQSDYDRLLWSCDLNFVRGEDSVIRALWAKKPFVWQIYPQSDGAHAEKLTAFLDQMNAPSSLRNLHLLWNGLPGSSDSEQGTLVPWGDLPHWKSLVEGAHRRLADQPDLSSQLEHFVVQVTLQNASKKR